MQEKKEEQQPRLNSRRRKVLRRSKMVRHFKLKINSPVGF